MQYLFPILVAILMTFVSSTQMVAHSSSLNQPSAKSIEPYVDPGHDDELFDQYETITYLMSNLYGRIGINDDAMKDLDLGRQEPYDIDPKDLKLVSIQNLGDYSEGGWVKINGESITIYCGSVIVAVTGEDWALMQRCPEEEVAIRRLMATFNEEGHEFVVSINTLKEASQIGEGTHRCIKPSCATDPLVLSTPTAEVTISENLQSVIPASQIGNPFTFPSTSPTAKILQRSAPISPTSNLLLQPTTSSGTTDQANMDENKFTVEDFIEEPPEELPPGRWLSKRSDTYTTNPRPKCLEPPDDFTLSGKLRTISRNPRKTSYTTITGEDFTTTSTVPHDPNRPPPKSSVVTPEWVTNTFFRTFSCRQVWMDYLNMDHFQKRDIVERVLEDLQVAVRG